MSFKCDISGLGPIVGNNVSHAKNRTKRRFMPNLHNIRYFSEVLGCDFRFRVAASVNRTIMRKGGIDAFLLSSKESGLTDKALKLKKLLHKKYTS